MVIENSVFTSNVPLMIERQTLTFDGKVRMTDMSIVNMNLAIPKTAIKGLGKDAFKLPPQWHQRGFPRQAQQP